VEIFCVAGSRGERAKLSPVIAALEGEHELACAYVSCAGAVPTWDSGAQPPLALQLAEATPILRAGAVLRWLEPVLAEGHPQVLLTCGSSDAAVGAQLAASLIDITCAHLDAGVIAAGYHNPNSRLLDQGSVFLLAPHAEAAQRLAYHGMEDATCLCGDTLADAAQPPPQDDGAPVPCCLCYLAAAALESPALPDLLDALQALAMPVLLPAEADAMARLTAARACPEGARRADARSNLRLVAPLDYAPMQHAVAGASLVITDSSTLQREAYLRGKLTLALAPGDFPEAVRSGWIRPVAMNQAAIVEAAGQPPPAQPAQVEAHRGSALRAARFITGL